MVDQRPNVEVEMPELPEVETIARQLEPCMTGRIVRELRIHDPKLRPGRRPRLRNRSVVRVCRSGKRVLVGFSSVTPGGAAIWMAVHLRMTGRLTWHPEGTVPDRNHLRAQIRFDRGSLLFHDTRRFGTLTWHPTAEDAAPTGVDPFATTLTPAAFASMLGGGRQSVKVWLMRQDRLAGIGNIYASEILHAAAISPARFASSLDRADARRLLGATRRILRRAIKNCGTTFSDFQDARGVTGSYQRYLAVYGRDGEACRRCGGSIERFVQQQRSTYFCSGCQR
jgi:formamidopyrimidine-DNA glycosylase